MICHQSSLDAARKYIYAIDFSQIINKMVKHGNWKREDAEKVCHLYRNFLFLNKKYADKYGQLPPSVDIDEFWHNHILDTEKYARDCEFIFGTFFHHYPYLGLDGKTNMQDLENFFNIVQELYFKEFNEYIYIVRKRPFKQLLEFVKLLISTFRPKSSKLLIDSKI